jgi:hypothetical protein
MFEIFNNPWMLLVCVFLIYSIYKKIKNLNKPLEETKFIEQMKNQQKLKKKLNFNNIVDKLPQMASYYVGIN